MANRTSRAYTLVAALGVVGASAALSLGCAREAVVVDEPATPPREAPETLNVKVELKLPAPRPELGCGPGGDDDAFDELLARAAALSRPPDAAQPSLDVFVRVRHRHALCRAHRLPSGITLVGDPGAGFVQTQPATGLLELDRVHDVIVRGLELELPEDPGRHELGAIAKGITIFASSKIEISDNTIIGGKFGIFLADSDAGGLASVPAPETPCSLAPANRDVVLRANRIESSQSSGVVVHALEGGAIEANLIRGSRRQDGLKMSCGPIREVLVTHNILSDNARDGLDVAWLAVPGVGEFRDNSIRANLATRNHLQGFELKSTQACGPERELMGLGSGELSDNVAINNGGYGLALQKVFAPGSCDALEAKLELRNNFVWSDGADPHRGGLIVNSCQNLRFVDNLILGHERDGVCRPWRCSVRERECVDASDPAGAELPLHFACDVSLRGEGNAHLEFIGDRHRSAIEAGADGVGRPIPAREHPDLVAPDPLDALRLRLRGTPLCEDRDGDGCADALEAILGRDPARIEVQVEGVDLARGQCPHARVCGERS